MKLHATVSEAQFEVDVRQQGSRVVASVDGHSYDLELTRASGRDFLILNQGRVLDCRVDGLLSSGATVNVTVGANRYDITLVDPKRLRSASGAGAHGEGTARMVAPMPGKVVRVLVEAGQKVEVGQGVVVVEAMKMQNEMKAPKAGAVVTVNVEVGATVNGGDLLAVIE